MCQNCGRTEIIPNEKMTDVNIAVELLSDAYLDQYDTALLISADSDLAPPIVKVRKLFPKKRIVVIFPPNRASKELKKVSTAYLSLGRGPIARSQFPLNVTSLSGYVLQKPNKWA
jgi:uncharacterized LabA/DUF88 family protein